VVWVYIIPTQILMCIQAQEVPFTRVPICSGPNKCSLSEAIRQSVSTKWRANFGAKYENVKAGVSGSIVNRASGSSQSYSFSRDLNAGECGYFTFLPIQRDTCGSYSESANGCNGPNVQRQTIGNACVNQYCFVKGKDEFKDALEDVHGKVIMVMVDCLTLEPLDNSHQDAAYGQPGVALPRDTPHREGYNALWKATAQGALVAQRNNDVDCAAGPALVATDCQAAIVDILRTDDPRPVWVPKGKKGSGYEAGVRRARSHGFPMEPLVLSGRITLTCDFNHRLSQATTVTFGCNMTKTGTTTAECRSLRPLPVSCSKDHNDQQKLTSV
jgi:hypothetical protein